MTGRRSGSVITGLAITVLGLASLALGTDGFAAYTSESARRLAIVDEARPLPAVTLQNQDAVTFDLGELRGRLLAIEFIYTTCPTLCNSLGIAFQRLRDALPDGVLGTELILLSISFDPEVDTPPRLQRYADRFGADGNAWRVVRVADRQQLETLLKAFGVIVIPNEYGGFEHNAAIHIADRTGRLTDIEDHDQVQVVAAKLSARL